MPKEFEKALPVENRLCTVKYVAPTAAATSASCFPSPFEADPHSQAQAKEEQRLSHHISMSKLNASGVLNRQHCIAMQCYVDRVKWLSA